MKQRLSVLADMLWYFPRYLIRRKYICAPRESNRVTMVSANVRCLNAADLGKKSWFYRAGLLMEDIASQTPGIIGFQEVTSRQYRYLAKALKDYDSVIAYRDDSSHSEGCPIFYSTKLYALLDHGSFWLSKTPEVMSKDWGAALYRICSFVILQERSSGKEFVVFNTHLDHISDEARTKGMEVVLEKIRSFGDKPAVIMGDMNAAEDSQTYRSMTEYFLDARYAAPETTDSCTFHCWGNPEMAARIDYFMISKEGFTPLRYDVLKGAHDGVYVSDHWPIVLELTLN
jgi:endonuclease/exonuclease/phosphatase family metal-dependent hydrolase